jgi:RNA polymerase primary sigma factor
MSFYGEDSSVKLYLQEIGKTPLLTAEEEIELAAKIKEGDEKAREKMIKANLRLVVKIAYDYSNFGLPILDLISEGNIGLIKAVERFDPNKGGKLGTYASWWIKQSIKRALANQSKTIRLPVHMVDKISKMRKEINRMTEELGREPTNEEIAHSIGITVSKVAHLKSVSVRPTSLDAPVGDSEDTELGELVGDDKAINPLDDLSNKSQINDVQRILNQLDPREAEIIRMRFGLDGMAAKTLEEVGKHFNITRERVRQLQFTALKKLKKRMAKKEVQHTAQDLKDAELQKKKMEILKEFMNTERK